MKNGNLFVREKPDSEVISKKKISDLEKLSRFIYGSGSGSFFPIHEMK